MLTVVHVFYRFPPALGRARYPVIGICTMVWASIGVLLFPSTAAGASPTVSSTTTRPGPVKVRRRARAGMDLRLRPGARAGRPVREAIAAGFDPEFRTEESPGATPHRLG